eukprot:13420042-Ditylum_brightwellii.AAC.1
MLNSTNSRCCRAVNATAPSDHLQALASSLPPLSKSSMLHSTSMMWTTKHLCKKIITTPYNCCGLPLVNMLSPSFHNQFDVDASNLQ